MRKIVLFLILCLLTVGSINSQDISGDWVCSFQKKHKTEITIEKIDNNNYKGYYCSLFNNGSKIDCNNLEVDFCIFLTKTSNNVFTGTFESFFSKSIGEIKIEYYQNTNEIKLTITKEPIGEFYLPNNVIFTK